MHFSSLNDYKFGLPIIILLRLSYAVMWSKCKYEQKQQQHHMPIMLMSRFLKKLFLLDVNSNMPNMSHFFICMCCHDWPELAVCSVNVKCEQISQPVLCVCFLRTIVVVMFFECVNQQEKTNIFQTGFVRVDKDYVLGCALQVKSVGCKHFQVMTVFSANKNSSLLYNRIKVSIIYCVQSTWTFNNSNIGLVFILMDQPYTDL